MEFIIFVNETPLLLATKLSHSEIVTELLKSGANVNMSNVKINNFII